MTSSGEGSRALWVGFAAGTAVGVGLQVFWKPKVTGESKHEYKQVRVCACLFVNGFAVNAYNASFIPIMFV